MFSPTRPVNLTSLDDTNSFISGDRPVEVRLAEGASGVSRALTHSTTDYSVAVAQISTYPGQIDLNTEKIVACINEAKRREARFVVFPELTVPGYCSLDLFFDRTYIQRNLLALEKIRPSTSGITAIVGLARPAEGVSRPGGRPALYNSAAVISDGKLLGFQDKSLLPTYDIFDEERYFIAGETRRIFEVNGVKIGVLICEDLWSTGYHCDPAMDLALQGADLIFSLNASPFHLGKFPVRAGLVGKASENYNVPLIYTNLIGSFDGYEGEVVFDGRSIVMNRGGSLIGVGKSFKEELFLVDIHKAKELQLPDFKEVAELYDALVLGIRDWFYRAGRARGAEPRYAIIGLSGGIDSAIVAALAVDALGAKRVLGVSMPSKYNLEETKNDALKVAEALKLKFKTVPIQSCVDGFLKNVREDPEIADKPEDVAEESLQAQTRMEILMFYAKKLNGAVLNTGNKTELTLDNFSIYGDACGLLGVLADVEKDRIYALASYINERAGREIIPQSTIDRVPTAELKADQRDSNVMGADPQVIAPVTRALVEDNMALSELIKGLGDRFDQKLLVNAYRRLHNGELKRRQLPGAIRVTPHAFGFGRRIPINHGYIEETPLPGGVTAKSYQNANKVL